MIPQEEFCERIGSALGVGNKWKRPNARFLLEKLEAWLHSHQRIERLLRCKLEGIQPMIHLSYITFGPQTFNIDRNFNIYLENSRDR